jgi:trigger factor
MQVIETKAEGLKRQYRVTVEAQEIQGKIEEKLESLRGTVNMKGFRPGHVPKSLLRKMYGDSLSNEVRMDTIQDSVRNALETNAIRPALQPQIENLSGGTDGEDLAFDLNVEILPKVEAPDFAALELERPTTLVDEESVDQALQRLAEQQKTFEPRPADEPAQNGDRITLDIEVHSGEERIDQLSGEDISVVLGSTYVMPGLSEKLQGAKEGETREFDLTLPEHYPLEKLRGQAVSVRAQIKQVAAPKVPEIDEELAQ